jgi:predicted O-linked N-acetylglucosamine transferase (SPINDLY family)
MSDEALVEKIRSEGIDVLIDLSGHAPGGRPALFARRAAPAQIAFLGYPTTTGLRAMDFRISDAYVDPPSGTSVRCVESTLRMPDSYFCYRAPPDAPAVSELPLLRAGGSPTFGSFNTLAKISEQTLRLWAAVLSAIPRGRLLLKAQGLAGSEAKSRLLARSASAGIDPKRIEVLDCRSEPREHLECYAQIDVALDTFPYNGATTTCEALWMGVPVVSLVGDTHVSRMGLSILSAAGRSQWAARDESRFIAATIELTRDPRVLACERASLRATLAQSALMDEGRFVSAFEDLLRQAVKDAGRLQLAAGSAS